MELEIALAATLAQSVVQNPLPYLCVRWVPLSHAYSRDRNREHARNTRIRKKQYIENLKLQIGEMLQTKARDERDALLYCSRQSAAVRAFFHTVECECDFITLTARLLCSKADCFSFWESAWVILHYSLKASAIFCRSFTTAQLAPGMLRNRDQCLFHSNLH